MKTYRIAGALAAAVLFSGGALPSEEQFNLEPASLAQLAAAKRGLYAATHVVDLDATPKVPLPFADGAFGCVACVGTMSYVRAIFVS